jgi:hypothetical protein
MAGGIRPGQVPDWRPGAEFWKPLADGREVTIYPLLGGKGRLCVGPLADPHGYDIAYRYESVAAAIEAAETWDAEEAENPPDFEEIEFGKDRHPGTISNPSEAEVPTVGDYVMPLGSDEIQMRSDATGQVWVELTRHSTEKVIRIAGLKKTRTDGVVLVEVHEVNVAPALAPHHMVQKTSSGGTSGPEEQHWPEQKGGTPGMPSIEKRKVIGGLMPKRGERPKPKEQG